MAQHPLVG